jgi:hypothetical protein
MYAQVTGLELSLVDHRPQELIVLSLDGLVLEWALGSSGGLAYSQFGAKLRDLQVCGVWCGLPVRGCGSSSL